MEEWKAIDGFLGLYEVSNLGRVRSLDRIVPTTRGQRHFHSYILSQTTDKKGYKTVLLCKDGKQRTKKVHRLVAQAFIPNNDLLKQVNHKDGNKSNNNVANLEWCDNSYNQKHAYGLGLNLPRKGELNGCHKLTEKDVVEIRQRYGNGYTQRQLSTLYDVAQTTIHRVVNNLSWKD